MDCAGHAGRQLRQQIKARAANLFQIDIAPERRVLLAPAEHEAGVGDGRSGQRAHGTGGDGVDPNPLGPQVGGEITHARLKRRLGDPHDVVVGRDALGPEVGQGEQRSPVGHQGRGLARNCREGVAGDGKRAGKVVAGGVEIAALELVLVGESDGVDHEVEAAPVVVQAVEQGLQLACPVRIARAGEFGAEGFGQRNDPLLEGFALVGERELGAFRM